MMDITDRDQLITYLKTHGLWLEKKRSQHFLVEREVIEKMLEVADIDPADTVIEFGPGAGTLTQALGQAVPDGKVLAIEKDFRFVRLLRTVFSGWSHVKILHDDALTYRPIDETYTVVANLPYQISGPFLRNYLDLAFAPAPTRLVLMLQKEVVERLVASPASSHRGLLTVLCELYGPARLVVTVPKTAFFPVPAVDSAVVVIERQPAASLSEARAVMLVARAGFSAKRRTLENSLAASLRQPKEVVAGWLRDAKLPPQIRAEALTLAEWQRLTVVIGQLF